MLDLKLFVVTQTDSGYRWSKVVWEQYFLAKSKDVLLEELRSRYGNLSKYYRGDEEESHINVHELPFEVLDEKREDGEDTRW